MPGTWKMKGKVLVTLIQDQKKWSILCSAHSGTRQVCAPPDRWRGGTVHAECDWWQRLSHDANPGRKVPYHSTGKKKRGIILSVSILSINFCSVSYDVNKRKRNNEKYKINLN